MPADQLKPATRTHAHRRPPGPDETAEGVLAVLAGSPLNQVAAQLGITTSELADALHTYERAGRAALHTHATTHEWYQAHAQFPDWDSAETTAATSLAPQIQQLQHAGLITSWWFIRKAPCWRLRLKPSHNVDPAELMIAATTMLDRLAAAGQISTWQHTHYEPETAVFGGPVGMDIAHNLFSTDSHHILDYLRRPKPIIGRRELSILLCTSLFRAAGQEWFEIGDIWHRVDRLRPTPTDTPTDKLTQLADSLRKLLVADTHPAGALFGNNAPLAFAAPWAAVFTHAGQSIATSAGNGTLERGTRDILTHHVIFHWNRIGLHQRTQAALAHAARIAAFG